MSETKQLQESIDACRDNLLSAAVTCRDRAALGRKNAERLKTLEKEIDSLEVRVKDLTCFLNYMTRRYKNIEQFLVDKKEVSLQMLHEAIEQAGLIVPDADTAGIHLCVTDKKAKILTGKGQDINLREGSAYRTVMGMLIRYTLIRFQPDSLQALFLDEAFSTLSDTTADVMREYLLEFGKDILIVGIEQHSFLFEGVQRVLFKVVKDREKGSQIRKVE